MQEYAVVFSPAAADDLAAIRNYIADKSSQAVADACVDRLIGYCEGFARAPHRGTLRNGRALCRLASDHNDRPCR